MKPLLYVLILLPALLVAPACQAPQGSLTWTGNAPPAASSRPAVQETAPALQQLAQTPRDDLSGLPLHLTGVNKPEGLARRFRQTVPPETPPFVPRTLDGLDLVIADAIPEGWLAFYKGRCGSLGDVCFYRAAQFDADGAMRWNIDLNRFFVGDRYVEVQDVRYHDGALYFNEACTASYRAARRACSSLIRLDPVWQEIDWRTPPLTSNNIFILHGDAVVAGYGATGEPDVLYLIDRRSGQIRARAELDGAHQYLEVQDDRLYVVTDRSVYTFAL